MAMRLNRAPVLLLTVGGVALLVLAIVIIVYMRDGQSPRQGEETRPLTRHVERQPFASGDGHTGEAKRGEGTDPDAAGPEPSETGAGDAATGEAADEIEPTGYSIAGRVVDENGAGIADAEVEVLDGTSNRWWDLTVFHTLKTNETGAFSGKDMPRRRLVLRADKEGYCACRRGYEHVQHVAVLYPVEYSPERNEVTGITLVVRHGLRITGHVVDENGQPIPGATVELRSAGRELEVTTDEQGKFVATGLAPGAYRLGPQADGFLSPVKYYWQQFSAGEEDIVFQLERTVAVEGTVYLAETGEPVAGAVVSGVEKLSGPYHRGQDQVQADEVGRFSLAVSSHRKTSLYAHWENYVSDEEVVVDPLADVESAEPVVLELVRASAISGMVVEKETGELIAGVRVQTYARPPWRWVNATSDEAGHFRLVGLRAGRHELQAISEDYTLPEERVRVDVVAGTDTTGVQLTVVRNPDEVFGPVSGRVVDAQGKPVAAALVCALIGERLRPANRASVLSDADGKFTIPARRTPIAGLLAVHPDYIHTYVPVHKPEADGGAASPVFIVLEQGGASIEGIVRDRNGTCRENLAVILHALRGIVPVETTGRPSGPGYTLKSDITDGQGQFRITGIAPGTYWLETVFAGLRHRSENIELKAGQRVTGVELTLTAAAQISGKVTTPDGTPIDGIRVNAEGPEMEQGRRRAEWAITDAEGNYRLDSFRHGDECTVYPNVRPEQPYAATVDRHNTKVTCPAEHVDFVLEPVEHGTLEVSAYRSKDGAPLTQFHVGLRPEGDRGTYRSERAVLTDGRIELDNVHCGTYVIDVSAAGMIRSVIEPVEIRAGETVQHTAFLDESAVIKGVVVRKSDGSPVTRFELDLHRKMSDQRTAHSGGWFQNLDGSFECAQDIVPGTYRIEIRPEELPTVTTEPFTIVADAESVHRIEIPDGLTLKGRVVNESGQGVAKATLDLYVRAENGRPRQRRVPTDERGTFAIAGLPVGEGRLRANHPDYAELVMKDLRITNDPPMDDLVLVLGEGVRVFGRITCRAGDRAPSHVELWPQDGSGRLHADVDERGGFEFPHVVPGTYCASVSETNACSGLFQVTEGQDREVNLNLSSAGSLAGRISFVPLEGDAELSVHLRRCDPATGQTFGQSPSADVNDDGSYTIDMLLPGTYRVRVYASRRDSRNCRSVRTTTVPRQAYVAISPNTEATANVTVIEQPER
jgi:protocatechuate 3,4-dioxygenase beta subunit